MDKVLYGSGVTRVSKKGKDPYCLVSFVVNWIWGVKGVDMLFELVSTFPHLDHNGLFSIV